MAKAKIEISDVAMEVYKNIALWHNGETEEPNKQNLAVLSNDIVEIVLKEAFKTDGVSTKVGIEMGPDAQENMMKAFKEHQEDVSKNSKKSGIFSFLKNN